MYPEANKRKLLVEGNDDLHVIWSLCKRFELPETFEVIDCKGYSNLSLRIEADLLQANLEALGVIVDADLDLQQRWVELKAKFERRGYSLPENPVKGGCVIRNEKKPTIGLWIMPNNNINGCLEHFIEFLIPETDNLKAEVQSALTTIKHKGFQQFKEAYYQKAYISTWLAWQKDPGSPMGQAITKKFLMTDGVPELKLFIEWLLQLYQ